MYYVRTLENSRTVESLLHYIRPMARSKKLTKTVAIEPGVHEKLIEIRKAYKLRTLNEAIQRLISQTSALHLSQ